MIKFLWIYDENESPLELCLSDEEIDREIKATRIHGEIYQSLVLSTLVNKSDSNNLLFEAYNFNKNYIDFKLNIQIVEDENVIEEYTFDSTPRIEYNERFDKGSLQYMTRLVIKGENLNDYKN